LKFKLFANVEHEEQFYIHQTNFWTEPNDKPKLLIIHGFGATGSVFYKMIKHLMKKFRVTIIDMLGMGTSGRPPFALTKGEECVQYFVLSFLAWMNTIGY
jgi:pimeloyl-ACP methyl ester carboxylesterase